VNGNASPAKINGDKNKLPYDNQPFAGRQSTRVAIAPVAEGKNKVRYQSIEVSRVNPSSQKLLFIRLLNEQCRTFFVHL